MKRLFFVLCMMVFGGAAAFAVADRLECFQEEAYEVVAKPPRYQRGNEVAGPVFIGSNVKVEKPPSMSTAHFMIVGNTLNARFDKPVTAPQSYRVTLRTNLCESEDERRIERRFEPVQ